MSRVTLVKLGYKTDVGRKRYHNEDSLLWLELTGDESPFGRDDRLYVVADGMGGYAAGEVASKIAVNTVVSEYKAGGEPDVAAALTHAIQAASAEIYRQQARPGESGMGTTVACAAICGEQLYTAHVGDSRVYLFSGNSLRLLTEDHSWVGELVKQKILTPQEAQQHPQRHILSRAVGKKPGAFPDISGPIPLVTGDVVMLCTDGISGYVPDEQIESVLGAHSSDPQAAADALIQLADEAGGNDNATVIVVLVTCLHADGET